MEIPFRKITELTCFWIITVQAIFCPYPNYSTAIAKKPPDLIVIYRIASQAGIDMPISIFSNNGYSFIPGSYP